MRRLLDWLDPRRPETGLRPAHYYTTVALVFLAGAGFGISGTLTVQRIARGGYRPGLLPSAIRISGGVTPASVSLDRWVPRLHDQGTSNSCVGQTVSTMLEIATDEFASQHRAFARSNPHYRLGMWMSPGYIYNQAGGSSGGPILYSSAFGIAESQGDANYAAFPYDGISAYWVQPGPVARAAAAYHRISSWRQIANWDDATMRYELSQGRPLAIAMPVYSSFLNMWGYGTMPVISGEWGSFQFWHSMTVVGYGPTGLEILNSWAGWGYQQRAILSWSFLQSIGAAVVIADPVLPNVPKAPKGPNPAPFPAKVWNAWRSAHHLKPVPYLWHHHLSWAASVWLGHVRSLAGILHASHWYGPEKGRSHSYSETKFQGGGVLTWPDFGTAKVVYWRHWQR
jgi:hypothetical protein